MVTENKLNRRYKQINFIGLQNNRPYSPDLIRGVRWVDYFLFPRLKSIMKRARFADVAATQERVTEVLRSIPKEAFADGFQGLYESCQQCVVKGGDYFEGH
jgi:hypothetical protein